MSSDICEKVDVSRIFIHRLSGLASEARVSSVEAANTVLEGWAAESLQNEEDQCEFKIVFEDGFWYHGKMPLTPSGKRVSLARYVRKQLAALAGAEGKKRSLPKAESPDFAPLGADVAESAKMALDYYNI